MLPICNHANLSFINQQKFVISVHDNLKPKAKLSDRKEKLKDIVKYICQRINKTDTLFKYRKQKYWILIGCFSTYDHMLRFSLVTTNKICILLDYYYLLVFVFLVYKLKSFPAGHPLASWFGNIPEISLKHFISNQKILLSRI